MNNIKTVCVLGSGGREYAIGWAFKKAGYSVYFYPGNAGTKKIGENIEIRDFNDLDKFDLVIPGSEEFLVKGVANGRKNVFGPDSNGAKLEGSKCFAKLFMQKHGIPTARFEIATNQQTLYDALKNFTPPYVIKADGLAAGKGVLICNSFDEAYEKGKQLITGQLIPNVVGPVVVDEFLNGWELSAIAIVNGTKFALLPFTKDYKRAFTDNKGPNTGGMGAYGPVQIDEKLKEKINLLFEKTLAGLKEEGIHYKGFLYIGLMIVNDEPYVLEYNVRLGDPETEAIVAMDPEKFVENILKAYHSENFQEYKPKRYAVDVVLASEGYPDNPKKGQIIEINPDYQDSEEHLLFYAGVSEKDGKLIVNGGRVLHSIGIGESLEKTRKLAYENIKNISFDGMFYREDIAKSNGFRTPDSGLRKYTYSASGVDVFRNDDFTEFIKSKVRLPNWVIKEPTGYATILNFTNPPVVLTADGVGSKLLLHIEHKRWSDAAKDLIGMNYNDIICVGAIPKAFVDYLGVHHIAKEHYEFIEALNCELEKVNMSLVAGETAEIPAIYTHNDWDVAGFCVGVLQKGLPVETIEYGDIIIGIPASGFHSNGWSLIRKIIQEEKIDISALPFDILTGTRIYNQVPQVFDSVKAIAHVTGGGILRALRRILKDKGWNINLELPEYMRWIMRYVEFEEALKTFNMGYGMILVTNKQIAEEIAQKVGGKIIGEVSQTTKISI